MPRTTTGQNLAAFLRGLLPAVRQPIHVDTDDGMLIIRTQRRVERDRAAADARIRSRIRQVLGRG